MKDRHPMAADVDPAYGGEMSGPRCPVCNINHTDPDTALFRAALKELVACLSTATPVPGDLANALRNARTVLYGEPAA